MIDAVFQLYELRDESTRPLSMRPRLASWDASTAPSQLVLEQYLVHVEELVDEAQPGSAATALDLQVGLESEAAAMEGHDLDNYLLPVASRLGAGRFALVRGSKGVATSSELWWGQAVVSETVVDGSWRFAQVSTSRSADSIGWKQTIHRQITEQVPENRSLQPVEVEMAFRVGPHRNWANLWKPAIDSLGPIVGAGQHRFAPRDDLIVRLGLHQTVDENLARAVQLGVWWQEAPEASHSGPAAFQTF